MKSYRVAGLLAALLVTSVSFAQSTNLNRAEVAAVKAKLVAVQKAMGAEPEGYLQESEDFNLPTSVSSAGNNKFWPMSANLYMNFTDRALEEGTANAEQATQDFQAKYLAALASGDANAIMQMQQEMARITALAAGVGLGGQVKQDMQVNVALNSSPYASIDPDAVVFESPGVIALRDAEFGSDQGTVTVYFDPKALRETETLSSIELSTPEGGVSNKIGVFNIMITLDGTVADAEAWANSFDIQEILGAIDGE